MIKYFQFSAIALGLVASLSMPVQAETVDVNIAGTITPAACTPTLDAGGVVDYGNIAAGSLSLDAYTVLDVKEIGFSIACEAPLKIAITAFSGRIGSLAGASEGSQGVGQTPAPLFENLNGQPAVGLGFDIDGTTKIGGYLVQAKSGTFLADGVQVDVLVKRAPLGSPNINSWGLANPGGVLYTNFQDSSRFVSWANTGETTPLAFRVLSGTLQVQAYLNKASELNLSHAITMDGLSTIELYYL